MKAASGDGTPARAPAKPATPDNPVGVRPMSDEDIPPPPPEDDDEHSRSGGNRGRFGSPHGQLARDVWAVQCPPPASTPSTAPSPPADCSSLGRRPVGCRRQILARRAGERGAVASGRIARAVTRTAPAEGSSSTTVGHCQAGLRLGSQGPSNDSSSPASLVRPRSGSMADAAACSRANRTDVGLSSKFSA